MAESGDSPAACPNCGITFNEFRESGRFGCAKTTTRRFLTELLPLLENIHEDSRHVGKTPRSTMVGTAEQTRLIQLRNEQRHAIELEDYEAAARLRDEITALEATLRTPTEEKPKRLRKSDFKPETGAIVLGCSLSRCVPTRVHFKLGPVLAAREKAFRGRESKLWVVEIVRRRAWGGLWIWAATKVSIESLA